MLLWAGCAWTVRRVIVTVSRGTVEGVCGILVYFVCCFFFFQAEDGIRDRDVTGVQTCALPICGLTRDQVAEDLGVGKSTLGKWMTAHHHEDLMSGPHDDVQKELKRLRKENRILREERDILKKATAFFASQK